MTKTFNVSFPVVLIKQIDRIAKRSGRSRSELLRNAARIYVGRIKNQEENQKDYVDELEGLGADVWQSLGGASKYLKKERVSWGDK